MTVTVDTADTCAPGTARCLLSGYGAAMARRTRHTLSSMRTAQRRVETLRARLAEAEHHRDIAVAHVAEDHPDLSALALSKALEGGLSKSGVRYAILRGQTRPTPSVSD